MNKISLQKGLTNTPFISPNSQSLRTELHFQFIRFAASILQCASVCFHTEHRISAFWKVRFKKRSKIEQKDIITPMHCLAFPSALFGAPFHIDNRTRRRLRLLARICFQNTSRGSSRPPT